MVYQNHKLENIDSVEKMDGHRDPLGSDMMVWKLCFPLELYKGKWLGQLNMSAISTTKVPL